MQRLYCVSVTLELEMPVAATSPEEARRIGVRHIRDELDAVGSEAIAHIAASEAGSVLPPEWRGCLAYSETGRGVECERLMEGER
jgi:hypothetical protein